MFAKPFIKEESTKKIIICLIVVFAFSAPLTYAGPLAPGHYHPPKSKITENQAIAEASRMVAVIVQKGKLDASWAQVEAADAQKKTFQSGLEWVITFSNPEGKDPAKQTLYVFLSLYGQYLAANHIGY